MLPKVLLIFASIYRLAVTVWVHSSLCVDYKTTVSTTDWLDKFNDTIIDVPAEDMYYLLQTFASMAMARPWSDGDFVYCVTADLFKVRPIASAVDSK